MSLSRLLEGVCARWARSSAPGREAPGGGCSRPARRRSRARSGWAAGLGLLVCALLGTPLAGSDLLVPNFSFEGGTENWRPLSAKDRLAARSGESHEGRACLQLDDVADRSAGGAESESLACRPGATYQAWAWTLARGGGAELQLRFQDTAGNEVGRVASPAIRPAGEWQCVKIRGTAPTNASSLCVVCATKAGSTGAVLWDEVLLAEAGVVMDIGPQVSGAATHAADFGRDASGVDKVYVLQDGALDGGATPGILHVVDVNTLTVERSFALPGSGGGWSVVVTSDQKVYAGVYATGHVFRYTPGAEKVDDLGQALPEQTFLYGFCPGDRGEFFGGTFPGGQAFRYVPDGGFSVAGPSPFTTEKNYVPSYVRTVAYDAQGQVLYAGTGPSARLVRLDLRTGATKEVLPRQFQFAGDFAYGARVIGDKVLVRLLTAEVGVVLDVSGDGKAVLDASFPMGALRFTEAAAGQVYYTAGAVLHSYNLATKETRSLGAKWPANAYAITLLRLADQKNFPGTSVVGVCVMTGRIWLVKTCLANGRTDAGALAVPEVSQTISSLAAGPDGKIYSSGYLTGGTGVYTPLRSDRNPPTQRGVSQAEGITTAGGRLFFGGYPGGSLYEFDPAAPWREGVNPQRRFNLVGALQDRPFGMASDGANRVFMGTAPEYGILGGAVTVYDVTAGTHATYRHEALGIRDLSVIACAWRDGVVYGGTSVSGGLGATPSQTEAKLLEFTVATGRGRGIALPREISNKKAITSVIVGPDRKIWMMAEGWLVIYDPEASRFEHCANLFPEVIYTPTASAARLQDATLKRAADGWVYGTTQGHILFKLDPMTRALTVISATQGGTGLVEDQYGNLYFHHGVTLRRFTP